MKHTLSVLVEDESGALSRISGLFARRGFNIDSLAVGPAESKGISRLTMVVEGDDETLQQMTKQLNKLFNSLICISFFSRNSLTILSVSNPFFIFKRISSLSQDFSREFKIWLMLILSIFTYDKLLFFSSVAYYFK